MYPDGNRGGGRARGWCASLADRTKGPKLQINWATPEATEIFARDFPKKAKIKGKKAKFQK